MDKYVYPRLMSPVVGSPLSFTLHGQAPGNFSPRAPKGRGKGEVGRLSGGVSRPFLRGE